MFGLFGLYKSPTRQLITRIRDYTKSSRIPNSGAVRDLTAQSNKSRGRLQYAVVGRKTNGRWRAIPSSAFAEMFY